MRKRIDSPLMRATSSMISLSSTSTKRQGWLLKCDGAIAANSTSIRWCSGLTGSGKNGPLVVLRRLKASKSSMRSPNPYTRGRSHVGVRASGDESKRACISGSSAKVIAHAPPSTVRLLMHRSGRPGPSWLLRVHRPCAVGYKAGRYVAQDRSAQQEPQKERELEQLVAL